MASIDEVAPIIIDPRHDRFGQIGQMTFSGWLGDGTSTIRFEDGEKDSFNDGWLTGIPQFAALRREEPEQIDQLLSSLPGLKVKLEEFYDQVVDPAKQPPTPETMAARTGAVALINSVIAIRQTSD